MLVWGESNAYIALPKTEWGSAEFGSGDAEGEDRTYRTFQQQGYHLFPADLVPSKEDFRASLQGATCWWDGLERLFTQHTEALGYPDWGTKEVVWHVSCPGEIAEHWPTTQVIYLIRNFSDTYRSIVGA